MSRSVLLALPNSRTCPRRPERRALARAALVAAGVWLALMAGPGRAAAQSSYPAVLGGDPSLFSAAVFTGTMLAPAQAMAGAGLRVRVSRLRFEPAVTYGRAGDFGSLTGWATLSMLLMETPGLDSYVGGGVAYYRESSDAVGQEQVRSVVAPAFVAGIETDAWGPGLFLEARVLSREYGGDIGIGPTQVTVTSLAAGIWLPFGPRVDW